MIVSTWAGLHILALQINLYWYFWWFDLPMHFFGGAVVALGLFAFIDLGLPMSKRIQKFIPVMIYVLAVALLWEGYELLIGIPVLADYFFDTGLDIVMGLLGGMVGWSIAHKFSFFN